VSDERVARAALSRLTEPGDPRVAAAVARVGAGVLLHELLAEQGRDTLDLDVEPRLGRLDPERELADAARSGIRFVVPGDDEWPNGLDDLAHAPNVHEMGGPPLGLWVRGPLRLDEVAESVAVVGSRSATTYGEGVAREIAAGLARAAMTVVSGAAFGIDQAAHRGALAGDGVTVAVLACGVDRAYPAAHRDLLEHIAAVGAVISELPLGCAPLRMRFLARNRIIAAITRGTVVVEAALRSGALNTATWADGLSRPVMGVPGPVSSAPSQGVHQRIRTGPADVLELVSGAGEHLTELPREPVRPRDRLTGRHRQVLEAVPLRQPAGLPAIAATAGISLLATQAALTHLVGRGFVAESGAGWRLEYSADAEVPER
jgi:DNA processing protein